MALLVCGACECIAPPADDIGVRAPTRFSPGTLQTARGFLPTHATRHFSGLFAVGLITPVSAS